MSRMGQDDGKARIGGQRGAETASATPLAKMVCPQGLEPLEPLIIHHIVWDGRSRKLNSGVYCYALETGAAAWRKAILIK